MSQSLKDLSFDELDRLISRLLRWWGMSVLQLSLGVVFFWFGILKLVDLSPASELVRSKSKSHAKTIGFIAAG